MKQLQELGAEGIINQILNAWQMYELSKGDKVIGDVLASRIICVYETWEMGDRNLDIPLIDFERIINGYIMEAHVKDSHLDEMIIALSNKGK
jgi:hypothetical protein